MCHYENFNFFHPTFGNIIHLYIWMNFKHMKLNMNRKKSFLHITNEYISKKNYTSQNCVLNWTLPCLKNNYCVKSLFKYINYWTLIYIFLHLICFFNNHFAQLTHNTYIGGFLPCIHWWWLPPISISWKNWWNNAIYIYHSFICLTNNYWLFIFSLQ